MPPSSRYTDRLTQLSRRQPWLKLFLRFIGEMRIDSREVEAEDDRGTRLDLWNTQRIFLEQLAEGLEQDQKTVYVLKGRQQGVCLGPETKVLKADLTWCRIDELRTGDEIICTDESIIPVDDAKARSRKMRTGYVEAVKVTREPAWRIVFQDGREVICSGEHRWLARAGTGTNVSWRSILQTPERLEIGDQVRWVTKPWGMPTFDDGWFGGMIDGEGSMSAPIENGVSIALSQKEGAVWDRLVTYAETNGYTCNKVFKDGPRPSKFGTEPVFRLEMSRMNELFRLIGQTRPTRFINKRWWEGKQLPGKRSGIGWETIRDIEPLGEMDLIDLQTSHGTFIAEGFVSHNSTITLALFLFMICVRPRTIGALVTPDDEVRDAFRDTLNRYVASFPPNFFGERFAKVRHNDKHFLFSQGSRIDYLIAGKRRKNWGESRGYSVCLCTEVAKYGEQAGIESFLEALAQENPNRMFLFESTADGIQNPWHDMWLRAADEPTINRIFLGWWAKEINRLRTGTPNYLKFCHPPTGEEHELCTEVLDEFGHVVTMEQLAWWRWKLSLSDRQSMDQNQPWNPRQAFVMSGYSFFQMRRLQNLYEEIYNDPLLQFKAYKFVMGNTFWSMVMEPIVEPERYDEIELKVWEEPTQEGQYVIGCDPAYGSSEDSHHHGISVWRCYADKLVQVAEYADSHYETKHCAWILAGLAGAYKNCMVNLELYGPGRIVMNEFDNIRNQLRQEMYQPLNDERRWDEEFMAYARWFMYRRVDQPGPGFVYNFETTARRKWELFNLYRDYFTSEILVIKSVKLVEEMATYVQEKAEIAPTCPDTRKGHGDRTFAAALAAYAWNEWLRLPLIAAGATYDRITKEAAGISTVASRMMDRLVYSYFQRKEEEAAELEDAGPWASDQWRSDRGIL